MQLSGEKIADGEFEECIFEQCSFVNCCIERCKFITCKFKDCLISANKLTDSQFSEIVFTNTKAIGLDWTKARRVQELSFKDCQINFSNFRFLKLPGIKIIDCEAIEVDFGGTQLESGEFYGTNFERSVFSKTNLIKADFRRAKNYAIDVRDNKIGSAKFSVPEVLGLLQYFHVVIE